MSEHIGWQRRAEIAEKQLADLKRGLAALVAQSGGHVHLLDETLASVPGDLVLNWRNGQNGMFLWTEDGSGKPWPG